MIALAFLNSVLMMEKLLKLSRLLSAFGATFTDMAVIIAYIQPRLLILTIPMSLLLSILLVYGRMNLDSELIILRTSGMNFAKISSPVMAFGMLCFIAALAVSFYIGPKSSYKLREKIRQIIAVRSVRAVEQDTFNSAFRDIVIMVKGKKSPDTFENIFIYDSRDKKTPRVVMAREGKLFAQNDNLAGLFLKDGYINITKGSNITELFFDSYKLTLNLDSALPAPRNSEFTPLELLELADSKKESGEKAALLLEFHRRLSLPAVCILLVFLGPPLSLMAGKSGRLGGLAVGLFVFTAYHILLIQFEHLVKAGKMPHYAGAWIPFLILGASALFFYRRECSR